MALAAGILASLPAGIIGTYVVSKRIVFVAGSIAHSVLGGLGLFLYLQRVHGMTFLRPVYGALISALACAWIIAFVKLKYREREDTVIAAIWALGMAIGVIFVSITPGFTSELMGYLFGNILWSSPRDLLVLGILDCTILFITIPFHHYFVLICFDEKQAKLKNIPVQLYYFLLLSLVAITVVTLIQVVGIILLIAFLTLPAAMALGLSDRLPKVMSLATFLSIAMTIIGIAISYALNLPTGATITLTAIVIYLFSLLSRAAS